MHYREVILEVIRLFYAHPFFVAFAGGFLGEEVLLFLVFLSVHMRISMVEIVIFGFLGILAFDSILFLFSRSAIIGKIKNKAKFLRRIVKAPNFVYRFYKKHSLLTLMFSKFVYTIRIPVIAYVSHKKISYKKFLINDILAVGVWAIIMIPLAMLAGKGFAGGMHIAKNFERIVGIGVLFIAVLYLINRVIFDEILIKNFKSIKKKMF